MRTRRECARERGFEFSSESGVGALLASLAAASPNNARIAELGTGAGVGLAWIVHGLGERGDASVYTVETDTSLLSTVAAAGWPGYVQFVHDDGAHAVRELAPFDLVFADAVGGKVEGLDRTIDSLAAGGVLLVDDMDPARHADDGLLKQLGVVRDQIFADPSLVAAELDFASGVIVATKRSR